MAIWSRETKIETVNGHACKVYVARPKAIYELLDDAARWDDREFLVYGDDRITFSSFRRQVDAAALRLSDAGVTRGDRVAILAFNRPGWLTSFWAAQKLGAVSVLANALWNDAELAPILGDLGLKVIVTDRPNATDTLPGVTVIGVEEIEALRPVDTSRCSVSVVEDSPAIVMFSSGTTGSPKGTVMSHRSIVANIQNLLVLTGRLPDEMDQEKPGTISLLTMPFFHLGGIQTSFSTMLSGGKIVLMKGRFDTSHALELIETEKVRAWGCVPTMVARLLEDPKFRERDTSSLKSIQMGGGATSDDLKAKIAAAFPQIRKSGGSLYGLTEAGGVLAAGTGDQIRSRPQCVGRPLPVVELRIANADPDGVGEIMARTPTVTSGYLGDETPLTDPNGWLATGDLGKLDDEGYLYVTGRSKDIIIRGGENISSVHVEHALAEHPDVAECAVVPLPHPDLGEEVGAVVVYRPSSPLAEAELRTFLLERIGKHEIPTRWHFTTDPLPSNATGKISKKELIASWPTVQPSPT